MSLAMITGGANGLGATMAAHAARQGYRVAVLDRDAEQTATVADEVNGIALTADVTQPAQLEAALNALDAVPDLLINNAGILRTGPLIDHEVDDFRAVVDVNLTGLFVVSQLVARRMRARGGVIINVASINGLQPSTDCGAYAATKAAVIALSKQMAMEWGAFNIRVNSIAPGFIDAGMSSPFFQNARVRELRSNAVPLKRLGTADDVARCAMFLASDVASYISGENICIDGGVINSVLMQLPRE